MKLRGNVRVYSAIATMALACAAALCLAGCGGQAQAEDAVVKGCIQDIMTEDPIGAEGLTFAAMPAPVEDTIVDPETGEEVEVEKVLDASGNVISVKAKDGRDVSAAVASGGSTPAQSAAAMPSAPQHEHDFNIPVYESVSYLISEGYDVAICSCGIEWRSIDAWDAHASSMGWGEGCSNRVRSVPPEYGTHDVFVGYKCSCGAIN